MAVLGVGELRAKQARIRRLADDRGPPWEKPVDGFVGVAEASDVENALVIADAVKPLAEVAAFWADTGAAGHVPQRSNDDHAYSDPPAHDHIRHHRAYELARHTDRARTFHIEWVAPENPRTPSATASALRVIW